MTESTKYARGGIIHGYDGTSDGVPIFISPCETVVHSDGRITRSGVTVGHWSIEKARETLAKLNRPQS